MYDEIRRIQLAEKNSNNLTTIHFDIYHESRKYIAELKKYLTSDWDSSKARELDNLTKIIIDIEKRRIEKILIQAFNEVYNGFDTPTELTEEEKELYLNIKESIEKFRDKITGNKNNKKERKGGGDESIKNNIVYNKEDLIKVKVLNEIPRFMSKEGTPYGPFEEGEVVEIPREAGDLLVSRGVCIKVEV